MLLLFDIDATLIQLKHGVGRAALREAFIDTYSVDPTSALHGYSFSGRTDRQIVMDLAQYLDIASSVATEGFETYQRRLEHVMIHRVNHECLDVLEGVATTLREAQRFHDLALVTGNIQRIAFHKLWVGGIDSYFSIGAFGCEHADRSMLPPLAIHRFNQAYDKDYTNASSVIIGDAPGDVLCALDNGIAAVAVATGEFTLEELQHSGATIALPSLADSGRFLDAIASLVT